MTSTRDRLERGSRRRRWSAGRVVLLVLGIVAALLGLAAGLAWWLLPPVLAETPRERFAEPAALELVADAASSPDAGATGASDDVVTARVTVEAGWLALGVGPFLATDSAVVLSPDGAYRAEFTLLPEGSLDALGASDALSSPAPETGSGGRLGEVLAAHDLTVADAEAAGWHEESLRAGLDVRYTTVPGSDGLPDRSLAIVTDSPAIEPGTGTGTDSTQGEPSGAVSRPALVLIATTRAGEAARYGTVTAQLVSSAVFGSSPTPGTPPTSTGTSPSASGTPPAASALTPVSERAHAARATASVVRPTTRPAAAPRSEWRERRGAGSHP